LLHGVILSQQLMKELWLTRSRHLVRPETNAHASSREGESKKRKKITTPFARGSVAQMEGLTDVTELLNERQAKAEAE
jgi:hypothetical protein